MICVFLQRGSGVALYFVCTSLRHKELRSVSIQILSVYKHPEWDHSIQYFAMFTLVQNKYNCEFYSVPPLDSVIWFFFSCQMDNISVSFMFTLCSIKILNWEVRALSYLLKIICVQWGLCPAHWGPSISLKSLGEIAALRKCGIFITQLESLLF